MTNGSFTADQVRAHVRTFILDTCLPGASAEELHDDTPLVSSGIVDSLATLQLVSELEKRYGILLEPHEVGVDRLDTVVDIVSLVTRKL